MADEGDGIWFAIGAAMSVKISHHFWGHPLRRVCLEDETYRREIW